MRNREREIMGESKQMGGAKKKKKDKKRVENM